MSTFPTAKLYHNQSSESCLHKHKRMIKKLLKNRMDEKNSLNTRLAVGRDHHHSILYSSSSSPSYQGALLLIAELFSVALKCCLQCWVQQPSFLLSSFLGDLRSGLGLMNQQDSSKTLKGLDDTHY